MPQAPNRRASLLLLTLALLPQICAAQPPKPLPQFDAASIKPVDSQASHTEGMNIYPGGRLVITAYPFKTLIMIAFDLDYRQIAGGDAWISQDTFDLVAKLPDSPELSSIDLRHTRFSLEDKQVRQMLQSLLIERFQLTFHRESREGPVYLLERTEKPLSLIPTKRPNIQGEVGHVEDKGWMLFNTTMPQLARFTGEYIVHKPVLDKTGVDGAFDFDSKMPETDAEFGSNDLADTFLPMLKRVGLQLKPSKGPIETFVIDHAAKPTAN